MDMNLNLLCTEAINTSDYNDLCEKNNSAALQVQRNPHVPQQPQQTQQSAHTDRIEPKTHKALHDPTFLQNRCLDNLLIAEEQINAATAHRPHLSYLQRSQTDITPEIRKMAIDWMFEVCEEQKCQEEVPLIAVNYMDRILNQISLRKSHLQLLATACLLIASKLREPSCRALPVGLLVYYTDHSISKKDLIRWELLILSRLKWNVATITPLDFLELLLARLPIKDNDKRCADISLEKIRKHAQTFIALATREHDFTCYSASNVAASSIAASLNGLKWHLRSGINIAHLFNLLTDFTGVEQEYLIKCTLKMEELFQEQRRRHLSYLSQSDESEDSPMTINDVKTLLTDKSSSMNTSNSNVHKTSSVASTPAQQQQQQQNKSSQNIVKLYKSNTPTDVLEVEF